jgi:hypothetical protein
LIILSAEIEEFVGGEEDPSFECLNFLVISLVSDAV